MIDISIIILTYNAKDVTLKMLNSLKFALDDCDRNKIKTEVIVVDNGSTDGVGVEVQEHFKWLKFIQNENVGFSKGNNLGVKNSSESKYVLFLNPDITLDKDSISNVYKYMENDKKEEVGIATCNVNLWSGGIDWDAHRGFPTPWRAFCYFSNLEKIAKKSSNKKIKSFFGGYHLLDKDFSKSHEIVVCLGAFLFVRRNVGEAIKWWPTDYFLNGEDVDFCYQVKELQHKKIMYLPKTSIVHYKGASKGTKKESKKITKASDGHKKVVINSGIDAMKIFYTKYYEQKYPWILNKIVYLGISLLHFKRKITKAE